MTRKDLLTAARSLISDPKKWTQGALARDHSGDPIDYDHPDAHCFCAFGALYHFGGENEDADVLSAISVELTGFGIVALNDGFGRMFGSLPPHDAVLHVYDLAIERAGDH